MTVVHDAIGRKLHELQANQYVEAANAAERAFEARRARELPFLTSDEYRLLGPRVDPLACAGFAAIDDAECARDWSDRQPGEASPATSR
jgi:hypothetical protein